MIVRVKLRKGRALVRNRRKNTQLALAGSALLYPIALMAYVLGVWRLASDMSLTGEFTMRGFLAHWQVWVGIGATLHEPPPSCSAGMGGARRCRTCRRCCVSVSLVQNLDNVGDALALSEAFHARLKLQHASGIRRRDAGRSGWR